MDDRKYSLIVKAPLFLAIGSIVLPLLTYVLVMVFYISEWVFINSLPIGFVMTIAGLIIVWKNKKNKRKTRKEKIYFGVGLALCIIMLLAYIAFGIFLWMLGKAVASLLEMFFLGIIDIMKGMPK